MIKNVEFKNLKIIYTWEEYISKKMYALILEDF